jgi:hypothetical protein
VDHRFLMRGVSTYCLLDEPLDYALDRLSGITDTIEIVDEGPHYLSDAKPIGNAPPARPATGEHPLPAGGGRVFSVSSLIVPAPHIVPR